MQAVSLKLDSGQISSPPLCSHYQHLYFYFISHCFDLFFFVGFPKFIRQRLLAHLSSLLFSCRLIFKEEQRQSTTDDRADVGWPTSPLSSLIRERDRGQRVSFEPILDKFYPFFSSSIFSSEPWQCWKDGTKFLSFTLFSSLSLISMVQYAYAYM